MGLKYSFRHLFYGRLFHKDRLYNLLEDMDARITALEEASNSSPATNEETTTGDDTTTGSDTPTEDTPTSGDTTPTEDTTTGGNTTEP